MIVYFFMTCISVFLIYIATKKKSKVFYLLAVLPIFLVSGLRYNLGTDYQIRYIRDFNQMAMGIDVDTLEIGFKAMIKFCLLFTKDPSSIIILTSFVITILIMLTVFKDSEDKILSILLFILGGFFFESLNIIRQYLACAIIFFAANLLLKDKKRYYVIYILSVIIATLIHESSILAIILIIFNKKCFMNWKWVIPISISITIFHNWIMSGLGFIIGKTTYFDYINDKWIGETSYLKILINLVIFIFMAYIYNKNKNNNLITGKDNFYLNIQGLSLIMVNLISCHILFFRIARYFEIFQIMSIPFFISRIPTEKILKDLRKIKVKFIKNDIHIFNKIKSFGLKTVVKLVVIVCFFITMCYTNVFRNDNEVRPYRTIINKNWEIE